jgi:hypothetical protein
MWDVVQLILAESYCSAEQPKGDCAFHVKDHDHNAVDDEAIERYERGHICCEKLTIRGH